MTTMTPMTPRRPLAHRQPQSARSTKKAKAVDLVTGKAVVEYYFDPALVIFKNDSNSETPFKKAPSVRSLAKNGANDNDVLYNSKHLYMPCTIIKRLEDEGSGKNINTEPYEGPTLVKTVDGTLHKICDSSKLIALTAPDDYVGLDDILHLPHVTEASLLHTLRTRYKMDDIYTSAGPILISVNPYRTISLHTGESLYSDKLMMKYRTQGDFNNEKQPHLFQVADRAYVAMMDSVHPSMDYKHMDDEDAMVLTEYHELPGKARNQSIIISGESGAGKTEATKYIMKYLARITKKSRGDGSNNLLMSPDGKMIAALEDRVLSSNPLLETFGNAKTLRNDNSSRFGKFIHIFFSTSSGAITGASISNYLLEKTRITQQVEGERNYHIFYQLLASADNPMLAGLGLEGGPLVFSYLGNRDSESKAINDKAAFVSTCECLSQIGILYDDQKTVFGIAAGVLHLGNVQFQDKGEDGEPGESEHAAITEDSLSSFKKACELLGLDQGGVLDAILTKNITVGGKVIKKAQTAATAAEKRDALAKLTYSCIFEWLVTCVNETLDKTSQATSNVTMKRGPMSKLTNGGDGGSDENIFIGVLDIYGFECFQENGYEQLLINYCNEKLQRQFNENVFTVEQNLYTSEGIDWTYITFNDNRPCLDLIEGGGGTVGILNTLDDAWGGMGNASEKDVKFVSHLHKLFGTPPGTEMKKTQDQTSVDSARDYFVTPKFGMDNQFCVIHFAGEVRYTVDGFVEKNMETLSTELKCLGGDSTIDLVQSIFACSSGCGGSGPSSTRSSIRGVSVGSQFRTSLQILVSDLEKTQPHYIRCIKPNLHKAPNAFSSGEVLKQLRYSGMMEAIRIRREGYALREEHESFYNRFSVLLSQEDLDAGSGIENLVRVLSKRLSVTDADWQIGHSKIFLRRELSDKLERLATLRVHLAVRTIGRFGRWVALNRVNRLMIPWVRFRLHMLQTYRRRKAATRIAAIHRSCVQQQRYLTIRSAIVKLQAMQRGKIAVAYACSIRDPYVKISFREIKQLLTAEQTRLEAAVKNKNFKAAAELEAKIDELNETLETKRPLTRSVLEGRIAKAEQAVAHALARKDYEACAPLQKQVDELMIKRNELPTLAELKENVSSAETAVAAAAANRDFAGAANAQAGVDEAKLRLQESLDNETDADSGDEGEQKLDSTVEKAAHGVESRAQLEQEIILLRASVDAAIGSKDFAKASSLQADLDGKEAMRKFFPSLHELEESLAVVNEELTTAIEQKEFTKAGELHDRIASAENKIKEEKQRMKECSFLNETVNEATVTGLEGEAKTFGTRNDLEKEITVVAANVAKEVASKNFKRAQELNAFTEKLEQLRIILPTITELEERLCAARKDFDEAVSRKEFSLADSINQTIEDTEKKLQKEQENMPPLVEVASSKPTAATKLTVTTKVNLKPLIATTPKKAKRPSRAMSPKRSPRRPGSTFKTNDDSQSVQSMPVTSKRGKADDATSVHSLPVNRIASASLESKSTPVSKLRPKKAAMSSSGDSILAVTQMLTSKRGDATLVVDTNGSLVGIVTDVDITRRVVAKDVDAGSTAVSKVMTPNPTCVATTDSALDALTTMIENHFRHLPVVDPSGAVVGMLDIAKCLNDAISKLEKSDAKSSNKAEDTIKQVLGNSNTGDAHALALQALLGQVMAKAFGDQTSPTLGSLLAGKPSTMVSPATSIREAGRMMAEHRKAALVVKNGKLAGIFGFKDMMTRAVAKELPLDTTNVTAVMTEHPECVSPNMTVLEALQTMHDHRFLTLPVCADNGNVLGVVDVIDVIDACGGANGWRSIFSTAMKIDDDESDTGSVASFRSKRVEPIAKKMAILSESAGEERPVSKLRPRKPLCSDSMDSILAVTQMLASKRGDAALILDSSRSLAGILTDVDVTRRVAAKGIDPASTNASEVMTPTPTCVSLTDSAMDALTTMMENHFRHLPVVDDKGTVVGLLDIAKCLHDAISKLEKSESKKSNGSTTEDAVRQVLDTQATDAHALALQALLGQVMAKAFGDKESPTLGSLLSGKKATTIVSPETSLRDTSKLMAEYRKAALVVEGGKLTGICGFKDMMTRAVAKDLPLDITAVATIMTVNPESVLPEMSVLEALQNMHDHNLLSLPVCADNGVVLGVVDVFDIIHACGGDNGWQSIFSSAMEIDDDSDAGSVNSFSSKSYRAPAQRSPKSRMAMLAETSEERPVSRLRPKKPMISSIDDSVLSISQMLASKRADATIVVDASGTLAGILTDVDVTRRVVAQSVDPATTSVSDVMTADPTCVAMSDSAMDAMATMVENHFRHLPVLDDDGAVVGVLDIAKCLNDAITKLEKSVDKSSTAADDVVKQVVGQQGAGGSQALALQALLGQVMAQAFGNQTSPTLGGLLAGKPASTIVSPETSVLDAGMLMAEHRKAALIVKDGELAGIFGFKDMMTRVVAKGLNPDTTAVSDVMTPSPETVSSSMTVLEAMQMMHDNRFLTLPVCDEKSGAVIGVVSVMDVINACGGKDGWRSIFSNALDGASVSEESASVVSKLGELPIVATAPRVRAMAPRTPVQASPFPNNIPTTLEFRGLEDDTSTINDTRVESKSIHADSIFGLSISDANLCVFKVVDPKGNTHRIRSEMNVKILREALVEKGVSKNVQLRFVDDEGDTIVVSSNDCLAEAAALSRSQGNKVVKLSAKEVEASGDSTKFMLAGAGAVLAAAGAAAFFFLAKPRR